MGVYHADNDDYERGRHRHHNTTAAAASSYVEMTESTAREYIKNSSGRSGTPPRTQGYTSKLLGRMGNPTAVASTTEYPTNEIGDHYREILAAASALSLKRGGSRLSVGSMD